MNQEQQEQFRKEYKAILNRTREIKKTNEYLKTMSRYDKNGSHKNAILKGLNDKDKFKAELEILLKGISYKRWTETSKNLMYFIYKINQKKSTYKNWEEKLNNLTFELWSNK